MTTGPKDEPIAVHAKSTLLKIFSGISKAMSTEIKITKPVISLDIFIELRCKPRSTVIEEEQTNIWLSAVDMIADITAANKIPWIAGWNISPEILKKIFSLFERSLIIKWPAIPRIHIPKKTMQNQIKAYFLDC